MGVVGMLVMSLAFAVPASDRASEVHVHKVCGPVPWEAYQIAKVKKDKATDQQVDVKIAIDPVTRLPVTDTGVSNDTEKNIEVESVVLPINGDQWLAMYLTYMDCVSRAESNEDVQAMWRQAMKGDLIKSAEDASKFMRSASTLMLPSADAWWEHFKEMLDAEFGEQDAVIAGEIKRIDHLYEDVRDLRAKYIALSEAHVILRTEFDALKASTNEQDVLLWKQVKGLDSRLDIIEDLVDGFKNSIETEAKNS